MILLLDTSTSECKVGIATSGQLSWHTWQADRGLAKGLLAYVRDVLSEYGGTFQDVSGIGVFKGPGSFTGLRIGITVTNTFADAMQIPIVGFEGASWADDALAALELGDNHKIVMPTYGSDAHITKPRK
jgi:tRNA threonylcarbamoyladenosine biosynthesis protein TsaB